MSSEHSEDIFNSNHVFDKPLRIRLARDSQNRSSNSDSPTQNAPKKRKHAYVYEINIYTSSNIDELQKTLDSHLSNNNDQFITNFLTSISKNMKDENFKKKMRDEVIFVEVYHDAGFIWGDTLFPSNLQKKIERYLKINFPSKLIWADEDMQDWESSSEDDSLLSNEEPIQDNQTKSNKSEDKDQQSQNSSHYEPLHISCLVTEKI